MNLFSALSLTSMLLVGILTPKAYGAKDYAAIVNGQKISKEFFEKRFRQNRLYVSDKRVTRQSVMDDIINRALGIQKAVKGKLASDEVVKEKIEDVMFHAQVSKDLEKVLKKIGKISNSAVRKYYKTHPEYRTANILLRLPANPKQEQEDAALQLIIRLSRQLKSNPELFEELANKYTQSQSAKNGGDIGFQPAIRLAPEYFQAISGKKVGFISRPVKTQYGYHIIKVLDIKPYDKINKELYKKVLFDIERDKRVAKYYKDMRSGAKIVINEELLNER